MRRLLLVLPAFACAASDSAVPAGGGPEPASSAAIRSPAPERADDFALLDALGDFCGLYEQDDARAVVLASFALDCPVALAASGKAAELARRFAPSGVRFFFVDAEPADSRERVQAALEELGLALPVLLDEAQLVLPALGVERAAEALVVDTRDWSIRYRGAIGDPLADALEDFLAGRPPRTAPAEPGAGTSGRPLAWTLAHAPVPDFARDIVPLLAERCVRCHSTGGIAPWAMSSFERVRGWAPMMREALRTRRMPPWHADPHVGAFANDRSLTNAEASALVRWIDAGAPRGDGPDRLPELAARVEPEWPLGEPDLIVSAAPMELPAAGEIPYRYHYTPLAIDRDLWVRGAQVKPSNRRVLHHSLIFLEYPEHLRDEQPVFDTGSSFAFYVPGADPEFFPPDTGKFLPKGSTVVFQLHYTPTGKPEVDFPVLGLYLADEKPRYELESTSAIQWNLRIPPGASAHEVWAYKMFEEDVVLWDLIPHMHYRGRAMKYGALYPDGSTEILLYVPRYDFNWQTSYRLATPKFLPRGTAVVCKAVYDNSARNPANPDPTREVVWGTQSTDEMLIGNMDVMPVPEGWKPGGD